MTDEPDKSRKGRLAGAPYDWRRPTADRVRRASWNPEAGLMTPKAYGWGYTINWYRVLHPFTRR